MVLSFWRPGLGTSAIILALLALAGPARAESVADQERVDQDLSRTQSELEVVTDRARQAVLELNQATAALPAAQIALDEARGRVLAAQAASRQAERRAAAARGTATTAVREFERAAARVDEAREQVSKFVAAAYRGSSFSALNAVFDTGSPSDLVTSIGYLDRVADSQRAALAELTSTRMLARQRSDQADQAQALAETAAASARQAVVAAVTAQNGAEQAAGAVQALADQRSRASAAAESEREAVLRRYQDLKAESSRIAEELRLAALRGPYDQRTEIGQYDSGGGNVDSGRLRMPVAGWQSSDFGMRYDPYYQVWQLHAGTDFAAAGGSPIHAAASGTVIRASWNGGYGNYTCVYHGSYSGRGLSTCYAHQSAILVSSGQWVQRGQVIGRVGTTGASTGCHLHFEVRLDGAPVNPVNWLG